MLPTPLTVQAKRARSASCAKMATLVYAVGCVSADQSPQHPTCLVVDCLSQKCPLTLSNASLFDIIAFLWQPCRTYEAKMTPGRSTFSTIFPGVVTPRPLRRFCTAGTTMPPFCARSSPSPWHTSPRSTTADWIFSGAPKVFRCRHVGVSACSRAHTTNRGHNVGCRRALGAQREN